MTFPYPTQYPPPFGQNYDLKMSVVIASTVLQELISLEDAKQFLKITSTDDESLVTSLIKAARQYAEKRTGRSLAKKDYVLSLNRFPNWYYDCTASIDLWPPPTSAVDRIEYEDAAGDTQILRPVADFQLGLFSEPAQVAPLPGSFWPATPFGALNAVRIYHTAGYELTQTVDTQNQTIINVNQPAGASDIQREILEDLITAMKQTVLHWYQNRDVVIAMPGAGGIYQPLPIHLDEIFSQHRLMNLAMTFSQ